MTLDQYYLELLRNISSRSDDPDTQVGCILVGRNSEIRSTGCNRFPKGVRVTTDRLTRPAKYSFMEHAERNAIFNATRNGIPLDGCISYQSWYSCSECARALIQSGIVEIVIDGSEDNPWRTRTDSKWADDIELGKQMLSESGVAVRMA